MLNVRNLRPVLIILMALVLGVIAVAVALRIMGQRAELATFKVVVATHDLPFGTQLREGMLEAVEWPSNGTLKDSLPEPKQLLGRVTNAPVLRGEPLTSSKLAPVGEKGGLSAMLHEGNRAVTVKVNEIVGVAGFALPGNFVDVMVHITDKNESPVSKIVLERILVLALAQDASTSETKPRVVNAVTLEVTPQQAEKIDFARSVGALSLILRSQVDQTQSVTSGVRMHDLLPVPHALPVLVRDKPVQKLKPANAKAVAPPIESAAPISTTSATTLAAPLAMPLPLPMPSPEPPQQQDAALVEKKTQAVATPKNELIPNAVQTVIDKPEIIRGIKRTQE